MPEKPRKKLTFIKANGHKQRLIAVAVEIFETGIASRTSSRARQSKCKLTVEMLFDVIDLPGQEMQSV